jgi:AcrR family transcriptional regulator
VDDQTKTDEDSRPNRTQKRRAKTRVKLVKAAYAIMSKKGVDSTTIQEITDAADVGFGTFYNYFDTKDDIAARVLDCIVKTLGQRNDLANKAAKARDPVLIVSNSVRFVAREMMTNPIWQWWLKRPDLMVERMRAGFKPFGIRDMQKAIEAGTYHIARDDLDTAWSFLIWLLAGNIKDIVDGYRPPETERIMAESVLRVMGVDLKAARTVSNRNLPAFPPLEIDFSFELDEADVSLDATG